METKSRTASMSSTNYYLMLALATVLVVLAAAYFGQALVKTSIHNGKILTAVNKANTQLDSDIDAANKLVAAYTGISSAQTLISDALPKDGDYPGLGALLENAGNSTGVSIKSVSADQITTTDPTDVVLNGAQPFSFSMEVAGTYSQVTSFLSAIQLSARPIQVTSLDLSGTGNAITAQISGLASYQSEAVLPFTTETVK